MVNVTSEYKPYATSRHVEIESQLRIVDDGSASSASIYASDANACSSVSTLASDERTSMGGAFLTLEPDYIKCDRVWDIIPDDYHAGYWADSIGTEQSIRFTFSSPVTAAGISLYFDSDADVFPVSAQIIMPPVDVPDDAEDAPDNPPMDVDIERSFAIIMLPTQETRTFSELTLNITPQENRRVRLAGVMFGIVQSYNNSTIKSWDWSSEADVCCRNMPSTSQSMSVINDNGQFKIADPSLANIIHPGLVVRTSVIVDGYRIQMQDTLLDSVSDNGDGITATIKSSDVVMAFDAVGLNSSANSEHSMWQNSAAFIGAVLGKTTGLYGAGANGIPYTAPIDRASIAFHPHREYISVRDWLLRIAIAYRCQVYMSRDGIIKYVDVSAVDSTSPGAVDLITKSNSTKITSSIESRKNIVEIKSAISAQSDDDDEDVNYLYIASISNRYRGETDNKESTDNGLITDGAGRDVAKWLLKQYNRYITYTADWRGNPALDLFDIVKIGGHPCVVTGLSYTFDGYFRGTITGACSINETMDGVSITARRETEW